MELLEGLDADTLVRRFGPVPAERAIHLLRQICTRDSHRRLLLGEVGVEVTPPNVPGYRLDAWRLWILHSRIMVPPCWLLDTLGPRR
jgi:hypothetical protein